MPCLWTAHYEHETPTQNKGEVSKIDIADAILEKLNNYKNRAELAEAEIKKLKDEIIIMKLADEKIMELKDKITKLEEDLSHSVKNIDYWRESFAKSQNEKRECIEDLKACDDERRKSHELTRQQAEKILNLNKKINQLDLNQKIKLSDL